MKTVSAISYYENSIDVDGWSVEKLVSKGKNLGRGTRGNVYKVGNRVIKMPLRGLGSDDSTFTATEVEVPNLDSCSAWASEQP